MNDSGLVHVLDGGNDLSHVLSRFLLVDPLSCTDIIHQLSAGDELGDEIEMVFRFEDFIEPNDILVVQLL